MSSYTPGPWKVAGPMQTGFSSRFFAVHNGLDTICQTGRDMEINIPEKLEEQLANANLIAAAPELLELLEKLIAIAPSFLCIADVTQRQRIADAMDAAIKLILRIEGSNHEHEKS